MAKRKQAEIQGTPRLAAVFNKNFVPLLKDFNLPTYKVRTSARAKYLRLIVSAHEGVVVVIPEGYDRDRIPELVQKRRAWLEKHIARLSGQCLAYESPDSLPEIVALDAIGQRWTVEYRPRISATVTTMPGPGQRLLVQGSIENPGVCRQALRRWLSRQAHGYLVPWLYRLSEQTRLPVAGVSVKGQKTRWGSCSHRNNININYKLLFLPAQLVRYVFLHELCHTVVHNHSAHFWERLAKLEPDYRALHDQTRQAWRHVPDWVERA